MSVHGEQLTYLAMLGGYRGFEVQRDGDGWRAREVETFRWHQAPSIADALLKAGADTTSAFALEAREWEQQILGCLA